ncbi:MAG: hypothetical protein ACXACY_10345 [Candidatus Hodarchaeales archaeon]|jgi:hypothetical protein
MSVRIVQGFTVASFSGSKNNVKAILFADKDDISAGDGDIGDVLESLELHSTAADTSTVGVALRNSASVQTSYSSFDFTVVDFMVKQDKIKLSLQINTDVEDESSFRVLNSLGIHTAIGSENMVEITMQRPD